MNDLETEEKRLEAFRQVYGPQEESENPKSGTSERGFELFRFDLNTSYAQFRTRDRQHALNISDQYVEYALTPGARTPIKRERYYTTRDKNRAYLLHLHAASISFVQSGVEFDIHIDFPEDRVVGQPRPPFAQINIRQGAEKLPLAKTVYETSREDGMPSDILLTTATSLVEATEARAKLTGWDRWNVIDAMTIRAIDQEFHVFGPKGRGLMGSKIGVLRAGQVLEDSQTSGHIKIDLEPHTLVGVAGEISEYEQLVLSRELSGHYLTLKVPRFDPESWNIAVRGSWRKFASFPMDHPFEFDFSGL